MSLRGLLVIALAGIFIALGPFADSQEPKQEPKKTDRNVGVFVVEARAEPQPALKYRLLPGPAELQEGNAALGYAMCFVGNSEFIRNKDKTNERNELLSKPLAELPKDLDKYGEKILPIADRAARLSTISWQKPNDTVQLALELPPLLGLAKALSVRCRGQIAIGHFDEALETCKTQFALARHILEQPSLMATIVSAAIHLVAAGNVAEMMKQPGCPNLYWAIGTLPTPFFDFRAAWDGERAKLHAELQLLGEFSRPWSEKEQEQALAKVAESHIEKALEDMEKAKARLLQIAVDLGANAEHMAAAKRRLMDRGAKANVLEQLTPVQILIADEYLGREIVFDNIIKYLYIPYWQAQDGMREMKQQLAKKNSFPIIMGREGNFYDEWTMLTRFGRDAVLNHQRLPMLQIVEAIRMYAATNDGKLPPDLAATKLPLPVDPATGKSFIYEVHGDKAYLQASVAPWDGEKNAPNAPRFEISIKK